MAYQAKTDWQHDTPVTEQDINRWEQGILDAHLQIALLQVDMSNLKNRLNTLEATLPDNFIHNNFNDDLATIESIRVIRGYYNQAQSRLEV